MLNVLHVIPSIGRSAGGPSEALRRYINALQGSVNLHVATTTDGLSVREIDSLKSRYPGCFLHLFKNVGRHSHNISPGLFFWLWKNCTNYDLVHLHACFSPIISVSAYICRKRQVPYILRPLGTLSSYGFASGLSGMKKIYWNLVERVTVEGASAIHFTADEERTTIPPFVRYRQYAIIPIPFTYQDCNVSEARPLGQRSRDILFLSRIHPKKALDVLLQSYRSCLEKYPDTMSGVRLVIAGSGEPQYVSHLRNAFKDLESSGRVAWVGFVEGWTKTNLYGTASVFCLPSYQENFGVAVVEAMTAGLPVIVSEQVAIAQDILDYDAGLVVTAGNVEKLTVAISTMIGDPVRIKRCGENAKKLVIEKYGETAVRNSLLNLYHQATTRQLS